MLFEHDCPLPELHSQQVHLWLIDVNDTPAISEFIAVLSKTERTRANAIKSEVRKRQFQLARASLRHILSIYLPSVAAQDHVFDSNRSGKPRLADSAGQLQSCQFNVSHSRDKILVGVTQNRAIGVDIEYMSSKRRFEAIAREYYHAEEWESELLQDLEAKQHFYKLWTLKEAFIKAEGRGLFLPANGFYFTHLNTPYPNLINTLQTTRPNKPWQFASTLIDEEYSLSAAWASTAKTTRADTHLHKAVKIMSYRLQNLNTVSKTRLF